KVPGTQDLQRKVLTIAMEALPSVSGNTEAKVNLRDSALAAAHFEVGKLWRQLGETEKAAKEFREADAIYDVIAKIDPDDPDVRANLRNRMYVLMQLGTAIERLGGKKSETAACYRKAAELLAPLEQPRPGDKIPVV